MIAKGIPSNLGRAMGKLLGPATAGLVLPQTRRSSARLYTSSTRLEPKRRLPSGMQGFHSGAVTLRCGGATRPSLLACAFTLVSIRQSRRRRNFRFSTSRRRHRIPTLPVRRFRRDDQAALQNKARTRPIAFVARLSGFLNRLIVLHRFAVPEGNAFEQQLDFPGR